MRNPDKKYESMDILNNAMESGDKVAFEKGMEAFAEEITKNINADMKAVEDVPMSALIANKKYNLRSLSTEESNFYKAVTVTGNTMANTPLPTSIYEQVFEDLKAEHPLLSRIQFVNTTAVTEFVMRDSAVAAAQWGKICDEIKKQLDAAFVKKTLNNNKLSAFVNLCKSMLAIGPVWLDRFVREILAESIAVGLELAIVAGTGKDQPIGMIKNLAGAVVDGVYPDKVATALTSFDAADLGAEVVAPLTKSGTVAVNPADLLFIVNPLDYWTKLFGAFIYQTEAGEYIMDKNAIGATIVQSVAVPAGSMVVGKAKDYFLGLAMAQNISFSDDYRFLEDDRVYIAKLLAHGEPVNNDAFAVYDISLL